MGLPRENKIGLGHGEGYIDIVSTNIEDLRTTRQI